MESCQLTIIARCTTAVDGVCRQIWRCEVRLATLVVIDAVAYFSAVIPHPALIALVAPISATERAVIIQTLNVVYEFPGIPIESAASV